MEEDPSIPSLVQCDVRSVQGSVVRPPWEDREVADWEGGKWFMHGGEAVLSPLASRRALP